MTTVINNPSGNEGPKEDGSNGVAGMVFGVIILIVVVALFFVYVLPAIQNSQVPEEVPNNDNVNIDVTIPTGDATPEDPAEDTNN